MPSEPVLKFSYDYYKLPVNWEGKLARLAHVHVIELEEQSPAFLEFDTRIRSPEDSPWGPFKHYPLPSKGKALFLLFWCDGTVFQTVRLHTPSKEEYYRSMIGSLFKLERVKK